MPQVGGSLCPSQPHSAVTPPAVALPARTEPELWVERPDYSLIHPLSQTQHSHQTLHFNFLVLILHSASFLFSILRRLQENTKQRNTKTLRLSPKPNTKQNKTKNNTQPTRWRTYYPSHSITFPPSINAEFAKASAKSKDSSRKSASPRPKPQPPKSAVL